MLTNSSVKKLLSIVIPMHNSFQYLKSGLESLCSKDCESVEFIIVDDASSDSSYSDALTFKNNHTSIDIILVKNDVNLGPGRSRNIGMDLATGVYLTFLDSDDFFDTNFIRIISPLLLSQTYDCIIFDLNVVENGKVTSVMKSLLGVFNSGELKTPEAIVFTRGGTCAKVYSRNLVQKHKDIRFLNLKRNEDMPFTKCMIAQCKRIYYLCKPLYNYVSRPSSLMHDATLLDANNSVIAFDYVKKKLYDRFPSSVEALFIYEYLYSTSLTTVSTAGRSVFSAHVREAESMFPQYLKNEYFKRFPLYLKVIVYLIHFKAYYILRFLDNLKNRLSS